jgi:hypothetical protein
MVSFQTQNPNLGKKFRGLRLENANTLLWPFEIFYEYLGYFMTVWYIGVILVHLFPVLVSRTKKNLATLRSPLICLRACFDLQP